jgi:hypothetical protein
VITAVCSLEFLKSEVAGAGGVPQNEVLSIENIGRRKNRNAPEDH